MYSIEHLKNTNKFHSATVVKLRIRSKRRKRFKQKPLGETAHAFARLVLNVGQNAAKPVFAQKNV